MDQKELVLVKARNALQSTYALLEKILDDDDDAVLSAKVVGEVEGDETMESKNMGQPEDRATMIRRIAFERISRLCDGRHTPEEVREYYDQIWWGGMPATIRNDIYQHFRDPRRSYPELPTMGELGDEGKLHRYGEEMVIRLTAIRDIILLMEALHREVPDTLAQIKSSRERYERLVLYKDEKPIDRMRRLAFAQAEEISGVPAKKIAKVFDQINWRALRNERFAPLSELLFTDAQPFFEREPTELEARKRWRQRQDAARAQRARAIEAHRALILIFQHLRAEIAKWQQTQAEQVKRQLAAHDQAA